MGSFDTPLEEVDGILRGPLRRPRQMLADQTYGGHLSIHDDAMAEELGFSGGPIEGPTHFSQFVPLLEHLFGVEWHETGCISAHYQNMCVEGDEVQAFAEVPADGATRTRVWAEKADGTPVLEASASVGTGNGPTLLDERMAKLRAPERLVILEDLSVGMRGQVDERITMGFDDHMGDLYPFTLRDKLSVITERSTYSTPEDGDGSPWGAPIIPLEMISVLAETTNRQAGFPVKGPAVGLFADQEIAMVDGPLFVGHEYVLRRKVVAISESRRTESYWVRTSIHDAAGDDLKAQMLLNHATLKDSYAGYPSD